MHDDRIACIIVLMSLSHTLFGLHSTDGEHNNLYIKDRTLVIQTVLPDADNASISCPDLDVKEENVHITLHKETQLHFTDFQKTQITNTVKEKQRFNVHVRNQTIDYVIERPRLNDTGLYNCTVAHGGASKTTHTFLLVKALQSCPHEGHSVSWLLLAAGCGILALYSFIVTMVSCSFAWKLWHHDEYQNDYINARPVKFSRAK